MSKSSRKCCKKKCKDKCTTGKEKCCKIRSIISCIYDGTVQSPTPIGFSWAHTLATQFAGKYNQTILLHGENLKYGLQNTVYLATYGVPNPFETMLLQFYKEYKIKIVICELCLNNAGFHNGQLLSFVKPIPFSVDFLATQQVTKGAIVIYDAQLATATP